MTTSPRDRESHFCQIHHDDHELTEGLARYAEAGLRAGKAVVVVTSVTRGQALRSVVQRSGLAPDPADRLLTVLEAAALLQQFMRGDVPDRTLFFKTVRPILANATTTGSGSPWVYGEMVNDLWHAGNPEAAVSLEQLWNELLAEYRCALFCGYVLNAFDLNSYSAHLEGVCASHSGIAETRSEARIRAAIDEACQHVLGIQLSSLLSHSQLAHGHWHVRLPLSRRAVLWLKNNTPSRLTHVLRVAREIYLRGAVSERLS